MPPMLHEMSIIPLQNRADMHRQARVVVGCQCPGAYDDG
jgi:hypothetical protein